MKNVICLLCISVACASACGGASPGQESTMDVNIPDEGTPLNATDTAQSTAEDTNTAPAPEPINTVTREELDAIIQKGPGYLLGVVQTDSVKKNGKFIGFKIVGFRLDAPAVLGVQPGDVVHHVNGISIEKPMAMVDIFEQLKTATTIDFAIIRDGEEVSLTTPVQPGNGTAIK